MAESVQSDSTKVAANLFDEVKIYSITKSIFAGEFLSRQSLKQSWWR